MGAETSCMGRVIIFNEKRNSIRGRKYQEATSTALLKYW